MILLGGDIVPTPRLVGQCQDAMVLAANSGVRHAAVLGLEVDIWLGDFEFHHACTCPKVRGTPCSQDVSA